ncbi:hypothetical protein J7S78_14065 [Klebsiella oxytoca]|uniref:Uncharacterized protein n=1 Tax=Klebsiella oxytoca TaxID=571 RepID=A0AAP2BJW5_KLEOX|nr:hypothetical protein [Klebsiella oxytoca]MBQ0600920.1 hypothetical protein [Klebsiella oxytoca]
MAHLEIKKQCLKNRLARARRNARRFYNEYMRYQGGSLTHRALKHALSEKHFCTASIKPLDRFQR